MNVFIEKSTIKDMYDKIDNMMTQSMKDYIENKNDFNLTDIQTYMSLLDKLWIMILENKQNLVICYYNYDLEKFILVEV